MGMAEDPATGEVTEEQAAEALRSLINLHRDSNNDDDDEPMATIPVEQPAAETPAETTEETPAEEPTEEPAPVAAEAAPGPHDAMYLFKEFIEMIDNNKKVEGRK